MLLPGYSVTVASQLLLFRGITAVFLPLQLVTTFAQDEPRVLRSDAITDHSTTEVSLRAAAISAVNGKLGYSGGLLNSAASHNLEGSISIPIGQQFGFQGDALYSRTSDLDFYGGAGHLFWRNPEAGLLGVAGGYLGRDGVETFQVGVEGEWYLGRFTLGFFAGVGSINYANAVPFIDSNPTRFVGRVSANYYPLDDLRLGVSYTSAFQENLVKGELEYQTPIRRLALTAEVAGGDNGYDHWLLGVRYYFGGQKSLRDRHRQDDPPGLMPQILHGLGVYGAEYNRKGRQYLMTHSGSGDVSGSYGFSMDEMFGYDYVVVLPPILPPLPQP